MHLRDRICYLLSMLRIHSPDCEHCNVHEMRWVEMRNRLEELSWRRDPSSFKNGDHREVVDVPDENLLPDRFVDFAAMHGVAAEESLCTKGAKQTC